MTAPLTGIQRIRLETLVEQLKERRAHTKAADLRTALDLIDAQAAVIARYEATTTGSAHWPWEATNGWFPGDKVFHRDRGQGTVCDPGSRERLRAGELLVQFNPPSMLIADRAWVAVSDLAASPPTVEGETP